MAITLPPDLEEELKAEVAAGRAKSVDLLAAAAIRAQLHELAAFRASLDAAEAEADRDGWVSFEDVKQRLKERRAARP
jgi:hypothetical protein